jgi:hypothetical protein
LTKLVERFDDGSCRTRENDDENLL